MTVATPNYKGGLDFDDVPQPQSSEERLREKIGDLVYKIPTLRRDVAIDAIMQAVTAEIGAALIAELEKLPGKHPLGNVMGSDIKRRIIELRNHFGIGEASDE